MTKRKASFLQGTTQAPYLLPAEDHRLNHAALWAPSSVPGAAPLAVQSGIVPGPGNPGAVTVVAGGVTVNPFHAVVQGTRSGVQGVFELTSDASEFLAITAASASTYRKGRIGLRIRDQLNGATADDWDLVVLYGAAAATAGAATLPAVPADSTWFELRTFDVSNTGAITLSGTTARTAPRGGILQVEAGDVTPGILVGQYRDHPTQGLQRWNGAAWVSAVDKPRCTVIRSSNVDMTGGAANQFPWTGVTAASTAGMWSAANPTRITVPETGEYDVRTFCPWAMNVAQGGRTHGIRRNGITAETIYLAGHNQAANAWYGAEQGGVYTMPLNAGDYLEMIAMQNAQTVLAVLQTARMTVELARR